ncbi:MAG: hypothetical protein ACI9WS_002510, partial [Paraglaciecola psychrophila]
QVLRKSALLRLIIDVVKMLFKPAGMINTLARRPLQKRFNSAAETESVLTGLLAEKTDRQFVAARQYVK